MLKNQPKHLTGVGHYEKKIGQDDEQGFFAIAKVVFNHKFYSEPWPEGESYGITTRCDSGASRRVPTPTGYHVWDDENNICSCGSTEEPFGTTNDHVVSLNNARILRSPIQTNSGFIMYFILSDKELEKKALENEEIFARTLQEIFRLMLEWDFAYRELGNRQEYAVVCHGMVEELQIPENIKEWLLNSVPDGRVAKFLKGRTDARERNDVNLIPDMTEEFDIWCEDIILNRPRYWDYGPH